MARTPSGRNPASALARLTIKGADRMSPARRRDIAAWLRECAKHLVANGDNYSARFVARYFPGR